MTNAAFAPRASRRDAMLADVRDSLSREPRELSPKYFYDERGSRLFEDITQLPEYYLTRAEREILTEGATEIVAQSAPRTLLELGAGSAAKTRLLLAAMRGLHAGVTYVPVDVSEDFLAQTCAELQREIPLLRVRPVVTDIAMPLDVPPDLPRPILFAFLGSTIGNFDHAAATALLLRVRAHMRPGDQLLLGTDLHKDRATLEAAYNDAAGVTAEFNRNILSVLNSELGADFKPERFQHWAFYDEAEHRIEMRLRSLEAQTITIPGLAPLVLEEGEFIRTELSHKYDRAAVETLAASGGLQVTMWRTDAQGRFALSLLEAADR